MHLRARRAIGKDPEIQSSSRVESCRVACASPPHASRRGGQYVPRLNSEAVWKSFRLLLSTERERTSHPRTPLQAILSFSPASTHTMLRRGCIVCANAATAATAASAQPLASTSRHTLSHRIGSPILAHATCAQTGRRTLYVSASRSVSRTPVSRLANSNDGEAERHDIDASAEDGKPSLSSSSDVPWFLQGDVIEVDRNIEDHEGNRGHSRDNDEQRTDASITTSQSPALSTPLPADLPDTLRLMHQHLTLGPLAGLLYKPSFDDDLEGAYAPIEFVDARQTSDVINWCDWVVFVTVRENKGGNINARVAEDVGEILKRAGPPKADAQAAASASSSSADLDDLLGPNSKMSGSRDPYGPQSTVRIDPRKLADAERRGQLAEEDDESAPAPAWAQHRQALKNKFKDSTQGTTSWRPLKILSRETQNGLRIFHRSDPLKWNVVSLAERFKISPESVRRILKAKPERWGGDAMEDKGVRRVDPTTGERVIQTGPERWAREEDEIERLRARIQGEKQGAGIAQETEVDAEEQDGIDDDDVSPSSSQSPLLNLRSLGKPRHPVRFEGLPLSSAANKSRNKRIAKRAAFGGGSIGDNSANDTTGEWALIDAGWCVVHVMTPESRRRYRIEDVWKKPADVGGFEDLEIA